MIHRAAPSDSSADVLQRRAEPAAQSNVACAPLAKERPAERIHGSIRQSVQRQRIASLFGPGVVQRQVDTSGGTFNSPTYEVNNYVAGSEANPQTVAGAHLKLDFRPNELILGMAGEVEQIGLIQTVKTLKATQEDPSVPSVPDTPPGNPLKEQFKLTAEEGDAGRGIDKFDVDDDGEAQLSPLYASRNKEGRYPTQLKDALASAALGGHWNRLRLNEPARLFDSPKVHVQFPAQAWTMSFEVAALVTEGKLTGTYLGSIAWGWEKPSNADARLSPDPIALVSAGVPSLSFKAAGAKWNRSNEGVRRGLDGEDHPLIPMPINDAELARPVSGDTSAADSILGFMQVHRALHMAGIDAVKKANLDVEMIRWKRQVGQHIFHENPVMLQTVEAQAANLPPETIAAATALLDAENLDLGLI